MEEKEALNKIEENDKIKAFEEAIKSSNEDHNNENSRKKINRKTKHGLISGIISLLVITAIIMVNIIAVTLTSKYSSMTADITSIKSFDISEQSIKLAENISKKTEIIFLTDKSTYSNIDPYCKQTSFIAEELSKHSNGMIEVKYIDLLKNPTFANDYSDSSLTTTDIIVSCGQRKKVLKTTELYNFDYYSDEYTYITSSKAEQAIDNSLALVTNDQTTNVVFLTDNSSQDYSYMKNTLSTNGYTVSEISINESDIPSETDMLVIYGPSKDYTEEAVSEIEAFLENGGKYGKTLIYAANSYDAQTPNLDKLLKKYGMELEHALVFETDTSRIDSGSQSYYDGLLCNYYSELYTDNLKEKDYPVITGLSRPVYMVGDNAQPLLVLSSASGECPYDADPEQWNMEEAVTGKECVLAQGTLGNDNAVSTIVVSGSYNLFAQEYFSSDYSNQQYLMAMLGLLNGRDISQIIVAEKIISERDLNIDKNTAMSLGFIVYALIPIIVLGAGLAVYLLRRNR